jgi:hypothetical protein
MTPDEVIGKIGALANADQWHIDYIQVNTNPYEDHININDVALVEPLKDLMLKYTSVPWHHVSNAQSIMRNVVRYVIRVFNKDGDTVNVLRSYFIKDLLQNQTSFYETYPQEIPTDSVSIRNDPFDYPFVQTSADYGKFEVTAYISPPDASQYRGNDTVKYIQLFKDYYAYDDGTSEFGIGISGESTTGAMMACRFPIFRQDTIRGVDIFFNKTRNQYTAKLGFNLCIWENKDNKPGDTLYLSNNELFPDANAGLLEFTRYMIPSDREIIVHDTVFVGIRQSTEDFMNIGLDVSHNNLHNVMFNTTGTWYTGDSLSPAGTVMMRPVFSRNTSPSAIRDLPVKNEILTVFPVPADEVLHINYSGSALTENTEIQVYDLAGRQVYLPRSGSSLSVGRLNPGMYLLRIRILNQKIITAKFLISR